MIAKRIFDIVVSILILTIVLLFLFLISILIFSFMGSPVFFIQKRAGLLGKPFNLIKFRTMKCIKDPAFSDDCQRLTSLGRFLRATSLDELPELWNVLKGEMSLVGPRPLLMEYLPLYSPEQARRHDVRPGITGWAQVNGRNALSWEEKFALDVWYVDHQSFALDLKILWMTLRAVLQRDGISATGHETMPRFEGSKRARGEQ